MRRNGRDAQMRTLPLGASGGAPCGATKRVRGVPEWAWRPHAQSSLEGLWWNSAWGHEAREGCAETCAAHTCERSL
eukprot:8951274-Pyramimonas_sp.AAC.1